MARFRSLAAMSVLKDERSLLSQKVVWDGAGSPASGFINWPVAMYRLQGKWFIYMDAARRNPPNLTDRLYALESDTDNPMGGWTLKGRVGQDTWTIGFCPFVWQGRLYMVVSNREHHTPAPTRPWRSPVCATPGRRRATGSA
jgi:GH43 family beta-xylosidase